jgi:hypothetical protein
MKDLTCDWQKLNVVAGKLKFDFAANLVQYASDHGQLWSKEESYWPADAGKKPATTITVGRVVHSDVKVEHVWNPSGGTGWQRLDILSRNAGGPTIATVQTDLAKPVDPKQIPVLHLTGVGPLVLADEAKKNLKAYAEAGGLVLVDAAGGKTPSAFAESFTKLAGELFGAGSLVAAPELPFVAAAADNGKFWYRHRESTPKSLRPLELLGANVKQTDGQQNWNVLFLPYDLTYGLVGAPASDPAGLDPVSAERLVAAVLNWRTGSAIVLPETHAGGPDAAGQGKANR